MKKSIVVQLDDKTFEVEKLPIGGYVDLIKAVQKLPKHLIKAQNLDKDKILEMLPELLADSLPDLIGVIAAGVRMSEDEVSKLGLNEVIKLVEAFLTVNKFDEVVSSIKKAIAHPAI